MIALPELLGQTGRVGGGKGVLFICNLLTENGCHFLSCPLRHLTPFPHIGVVPNGIFTANLHILSVEGSTREKKKQNVWAKCESGAKICDFQCQRSDCEMMWMMTGGRRGVVLKFYNQLKLIWIIMNKYIQTFIKYWSDKLCCSHWNQRDNKEFYKNTH